MNAWLMVLRAEMREAVQRLLSRPGYTALAVAVLAVGLGATLFVLGAINTLVLQPGPFADPQRMIQIGEVDPDDPGELDDLVAGDAVQVLRDENALEAVGLYQEATVNIADAEQVVRYDGLLVNAGLFELLGVAPVVGRLVSKADDQPGAERVALISYRLWQDRFGGAADIVGRPVRINANDARIIGVMPEGFTYPAAQQVWFGGRFDPNTPRAEQSSVVVVARLVPNADGLALRERLNLRWQDIQKDVPRDTRTPNMLDFQPISLYFTSQHTRMILNLMLSTALGVLLLACSNVAGLQAAQAVARTRELSVRVAMGASRGRILFGILCESFLLSLMAAGIGLIIAHFGGKGIAAVFAANDEAQPYWMSFGIDWRLALMGFGSALFATLLAGWIPAWRASGGDVQQGLRDGAKGSAANTSRFGRILIVVQVALSCVLLVGAGAVYRNLEQITTMDLGIKVDPKEVLTGRVAIFPTAFPTEVEQMQFFQRLGDALRAEPDVISASVSQGLPGFLAGGIDYRIDGEDPNGDAHFADFSAVDDYFFKTFNIEPISGRLLNESDIAGGRRVAVVDQSFVERHWPGQDGIGRVFKGTDDKGPIEIIGVVPTMHLTEVEDDQNPTVLMSLRQSPSRFNSLSIRVNGDLQAFSQRLPEIVRKVDADTPVYWVRTLDRAIATGFVGQRLLAIIFGIFGLVGLLLAAAGIYGLLSQTVANRTREIGVRRAIGASGLKVMQQVSAGSLIRVGIGLLIGLSLGLPWSKVMNLNESIAWEPDIGLFVLVFLSIVIASALAIWVPTRRALSVDPMTALRHD